MSLMGIAGTELKIADGAVGVSGKPIRVFAAHVISGGSVGSIVLRDGTAATDTIYIQETGVANEGVTFTYGRAGILFPDGCFYDHDANNTSVAISFLVEK